MADTVTSEVTETTTRPPWDDGEWQGSAWSVTLRYQGREMTMPFWQGSGIHHAPTTRDVLECLISDATAYENALNVWDFAAEFGYEPSHKIQGIYERCQRIAEQLHELLGADFDYFAYENV